MIENLFGGGGGGTVDTVVAGTGISVNSTDPANPIITNTSLNTDEVAKVSSNDTTAGYLNGKLVAGSNVTLTENNNGGNETLTIAATVPVTSVNTKTGAVTLTNTDVGAAATSHTHAATDITSGTIATARLGSGTANSTTFLRGDQVYATPPTGVTGFTGSQNTGSPNNTVNASRLLVDATSTNADAVLQPKGTGAFQAQLADSASTGGNKRGVYAVDLQRGRSSADQVASGYGAGLLSGEANKASNQYSTVCGGFVNLSSGEQSFVGSGISNTASGNNSVVCGGNGNNVSGLESSVLCGNSNYVYGKYSYVGGGVGARIDRDYQYAFANGIFSTFGDCQYERYVQRRSTTNATQTELSNDGAAPGATTRIQIVSDTTYTFRILVTARRTDADNESAGYKIEGVIDNNAGTTAFVGTPTVTAIAEDTAAWDVVVEADNTNDALVIKVTGEASKTIRWGAVVELMKVGG